MANQIITADIISKTFLSRLRENMVLPALAYKEFSSDFAAGVGETIRIRKPNSFVAKEFTDEIEMQDIVDTYTDITIDKHLDVSVEVTSKEMTLDIWDFTYQVIEPAVQAFLKKLDTYLINLEVGATNRINHATGNFSINDIINARKMLNDNLAPFEGRHLVVGTQAEADLLRDELFHTADKSGSNAGLREANLGKIMGFDIYVDQNITKGSKAYTPAIAFRKDALALVTKTLALPNGAGDASIASADGFGVRCVYGYDMKTKKNMLSFDMLVGAKLIDDRQIVVVADAR